MNIFGIVSSFFLASQIIYGVVFLKRLLQGFSCIERGLFHYNIRLLTSNIFSVIVVFTVINVRLGHFFCLCCGVSAKLIRNIISRVIDDNLRQGRQLGLGLFYCTIVYADFITR